MTAQLTRRALLSAAPAAALVPAASLAALPSITATLPAEENPQLLALGEQLPSIEAAYTSARHAWFTAWAEWNPQWPLAPECCLHSWQMYSSRIERDLSGKGLIRPGSKDSRSIKTQQELEWEIAWSTQQLERDARRKRSWGKRFVQRETEKLAQAKLGLKLLPGYLAECERIKRASNFDAIDSARHEAARNVIAFARKVLQEPSRTIEGVRIKARAAALIGQMHGYDQVTGTLGDGITQNGSLAALLGEAVLAVL